MQHGIDPLGGRTPDRTHRRSVVGLLAVVLALAACAPDEGPAEDLVDDEDAASEDAWEEEDDPESHAGDDLADADGVLLTVEPACAEIGDGFTVTADGLEPDTNHTVLIDPEPSATGAFEEGVLGASDGDGTLEVSATLSEEADIQPGAYTIDLYTAEEGETGEWLISADLEIAEECEI